MCETMKSYRITGIIDDPHNNTINLLFRLGTAINIFEGFYFLYLLFVQKMDLKTVVAVCIGVQQLGS